MISTKYLKSLFERMWHENKKGLWHEKKREKNEEKCYLDDGHGPSKDTMHLNVCKIRKLRVTIMKENEKKE